MFICIPVFINYLFVFIIYQYYSLEIKIILIYLFDDIIIINILSMEAFNLLSYYYRSIILYYVTGIL